MTIHVEHKGIALGCAAGGECCLRDLIVADCVDDLFDQRIRIGIRYSFFEHLFVTGVIELVDEILGEGAGLEAAQIIEIDNRLDCQETSRPDELF